MGKSGGCECVRARARMHAKKKKKKNIYCYQILKE